MAGHVRVVRCKHCRHRFYASENNCPECGRKSPLGWLRIFLFAILIALAIAAAVLFAIFIIKQATTLESLTESSSTRRIGGPSGA